jgi:hypothetical protein
MTSDIDAVMACYRACATNLLPNGPSHQVMFAASVPLILAAIRAEAVAAERAKHDGAAELIHRAAELIKTSADLGNTGRSLSEIEAIATAVAAKIEQIANAADDDANPHIAEWVRSFTFTKNTLP